MRKTFGRLRSLACFLLVAVMCIGMLPTAAFAAGDDSTDEPEAKHDIVINAVNADATYRFYKLLDLKVKTDAEGKVKSYQYSFNKKTDGLEDAVREAVGGLAYDPEAEDSMGFQVRDNMILFQVPEGYEDSAEMQAAADGMMLKFADALRASLEGLELTPDHTIKGNDKDYVRDGVLTIKDVTAGYWMVTSDAGSRSIIFTNPSDVNGNMLVEEKNEKPTINKTANTVGASIGSTVTYTIRVNAKAGSENLKILDQMSLGLKFVGVKSMVFQASRGGAPVTLAASETSEADAPATYTLGVTPSNGEDGDFITVVINPYFLESAAFTGDDTTLADDGGVFTLTYDAKITGDALKVDNVTNDAHLEYGHDPDSENPFGTKPGEGGNETLHDYLVKWVDEDGKLLSSTKYNPATDLFPSNPERTGLDGYWADPVLSTEEGDEYVIIIKWVSLHLDPEAEYTMRWLDENGQAIDGIPDVKFVMNKDGFPRNPERPGVVGHWGNPVVDEEAKLVTVTWIPEDPNLDVKYTVRWIEEDGSAIPEIRDVTYYPKTGMFPANPKRVGMLGHWDEPTMPDEDGLILIRWISLKIDIEKTYIVRWVDENGDPISGISEVTYVPKTDTFPENPVREGLTGRWGDPADPVEEEDGSLVIYIQWIPKENSSSSGVVIKLYDVILYNYVAGSEGTSLAGAEFYMLRKDDKGAAAGEGALTVAGTSDAAINGWYADGKFETAGYDYEKSEGVVCFYREDDEDGNAVYRLATEEEVNAETPDPNVSKFITVPDTGKVVIKGLSDGMYAFVEKTAPKGYNLLSAAVKFVVNGGDEGNAEKYVYGNSDGVTYKLNAENMIKIANASGLRMPHTGGIGTTVFYIGGACLMLAAAGALVILKKRSKAGED